MTVKEKPRVCLLASALGERTVTEKENPRECPSVSLKAALTGNPSVLPSLSFRRHSQHN